MISDLLHVFFLFLFQMRLHAAVPTQALAYADTLWTEL